MLLLLELELRAGDGDLDVCQRGVVLVDDRQQDPPLPLGVEGAAGGEAEQQGPGQSASDRDHEGACLSWGSRSPARAADGMSFIEGPTGPAGDSTPDPQNRSPG